MTIRYAHLAPDYLEGEIEKLRYLNYSDNIVTVNDF